MADLLTNNPTVRTSYSQADLRDRVRSDIAHGDSIFTRDEDVDRWGLEAQTIIARQCEWWEFVELLTVSGDVRDYDLPADCIAIKKVQYDTTRLYPTTLDALYDENLNWREQAASTPLYYIIGGASRLTLYPTPAHTSGGVLLVIFAAIPPEPDHEDDFYYAPVGGEEAIVYYCCWKASVRDMGREGQRRAEHYYRAWLQALSDLKRQSRALAQETPVVYGQRALNRSPWSYGPHRRYRIPSP
jgi:hypothetical protein